MKIAAALVVFLMVISPAHARNIDGVSVPEKLNLAGEKAPLALNGAGLRTRFLVKVYVAALYLTQPATRAERVLEDGSTRVVTIHMRRDTDSERIASAFLTSVARNHEASEMKVLEDRLTKFKLLVPSMKRDDVLRLEFGPDGKTRVVRNDELLGTLEGADFQRALLKIWLGSNPVDDELKQRLLGAR